MPIRFYCPFCGVLLETSRRLIGSTVDCVRCGGGVGVPREDGLPPPVPPPGGLVLHWWQAALAVLGCLALVALAFTAGLMVGVRL